jgi:thiol-disulfide isomerase/thioredoxin
MALTYYSGSDFTVHENNICILDELDNNTTTLLLFYSIQCPYCKDMLQTFRNILQNVSGINIGILNINKPENKSVLMESKYTENTKIEYVPYVLLFYNGKAIARYDDDADISNLLQFINDTTQNMKQSFDTEEEKPKDILIPYKRKNFKRTIQRCYVNTD